jgi:hypothetical protein
VFRPSQEFGYGDFMKNSTAKEEGIAEFNRARLFLLPQRQPARTGNTSSDKSARRLNGADSLHAVERKHRRRKLLSVNLKKIVGLAQEHEEKRKHKAQKVSPLKRLGLQSTPTTAPPSTLTSPPNHRRLKRQRSSPTPAPPQSLPPLSSVSILQFECAKGVHLPYHLLATVQVSLHPQMFFCSNSKNFSNLVWEIG